MIPCLNVRDEVADNPHRSSNDQNSATSTYLL